jgi:small subunit ribosomal protein S1
MSDVDKNAEFDLEKGYNDSFKDIEENSLIKATVIDVSGDTVFMDFGAKSEAKLPTTEFEVIPSIGDVIEVYLIRRENKYGDPVVSKKKADVIRQKREMVKLFKEREILEGTVIEIKKFGYLVKYRDVYGIIPFSLFDVKKIEKPEEFVGKKISFYIERLDFKDGSRPQNRGNQNRGGAHNKKFDKKNEKKTADVEDEFIGNRKKVMIDEGNVMKLQFLEDRKEGDIVDGVVRNISDFGAFVDLGGIEALLHIKDISWLRVDKVENYLKLGDKLKVKILSIDKVKGKVGVGLKQTQEEPWSKFIKEFKIDDVVKGTVTSLATYGAFVRVIDGVEGLLHISDMSWAKNVKNPSELLKKGQIIEVKIVNIDETARKINLSLKHLLENPWDKVEEKYKVGTTVKAKVKNIAAFGVFVELEEGIDALLHIDDVSWTESVKNPHKLFKVGDELDVKVIQCDVKANKIKVGIKQLADDPWKMLKDKYNNGDVINCPIISIDDTKGIEVQVVDNISTYIPLSQIDFGRPDEVKLKLKEFKVGDEIKAMILEINYRKQIVKLSIKEFMKKEEKKKVEAFLHDDKEDNKFTLGDMMKSKEKNDND